MANFGVIKTPAGFLKVLHVVLGVIAIGLIGYNYSSVTLGRREQIVKMDNETFFSMLVFFGFLLTSFLLLVTHVLDEKSEGVRKSSFEIVYHLFGFIFLFSASVCIFISANNIFPAEVREIAELYRIYVEIIIGGVVAFFNSLAYLANSFTALKLRST